jgi:hypothetical protein
VHCEQSWSRFILQIVMGRSPTGRMDSVVEVERNRRCSSGFVKKDRQGKLRGELAKWANCLFCRIKEAVIRIPCCLRGSADRGNFAPRTTEHRTRRRNLRGSIEVHVAMASNGVPSDADVLCFSKYDCYPVGFDSAQQLAVSDSRQ